MKSLILFLMIFSIPAEAEWGTLTVFNPTIGSKTRHPCKQSDLALMLDNINKYASTDPFTIDREKKIATAYGKDGKPISVLLYFDTKEECLNAYRAETNRILGADFGLK